MTILPESIVVANEEFFSFIVPEAEVVEALQLTKVPDDFPVESLRGLPIIEHRLTAWKDLKSGRAARVMFKHPRNPNSSVKTGAK